MVQPVGPGTGKGGLRAFTAELKPGLLATFDMPQYPGQRFDAKVVTTSNAMEMNSRSMLVELQADSADGELFALAYCQVHIQLPNNPNVMRVPALVSADRGAQVALLGNDDEAVLKPVPGSAATSETASRSSPGSPPRIR